MKPNRKVSKRQLQQYLNELSALAKTVTQDVEPIIHSRRRRTTRMAKALCSGRIC
jgi:hypothetical protein